MKIIFVVGMHRSGTSLLVEILGNLGVQLPPDLIFDSDYPGVCLYESASVVSCNERILARSGQTWLSPLINSKLSEVDEADVLFTLKTIFSDAAGGVVAIKDPRFCFYLSGWVTAALRLKARVHVLCVMRDPEDVVNSLYRRNGVFPMHGLHLWVQYNYALSLLLKELPSDAWDIVDYESLKRDPHELCNHIECVVCRWECKLSRPRQQLSNEVDMSTKAVVPEYASPSTGISERIRMDWNLYGRKLLCNPEVLAMQAQLMNDGSAEYERSYYGELLIGSALARFEIEKSRGVST